MYTDIKDFLRQQCAKYSISTAFYIKRQFRIERVTYKELDTLIKKFGTLLKNVEIIQGDKVVIIGANMPEWGIAFLGSLAFGVTVVPINTYSTQENIEKYIEQTKPKAFFISEKIKTQIEKYGLKQIKLENLLSELENLPESQIPSINIDQQAEIAFTSGSTGNPKGVVITHKNILSQIENLSQAAPQIKNQRFLSVLPLSHILEQIVGLFIPLNFGGAVYYLTSINLVTIIKALQTYKITHLVVVPQLLRVFYENLEYKLYKKASSQKFFMRNKGGIGLSGFKILKEVSLCLPFWVRRILFRPIHKILGKNLRVIACGGSHLGKALAKSWEALGILILEGYGTTETTGPIAINTQRDKRLGSCGKPMNGEDGVDIKLSDEKEILVKGNVVFENYFNKEPVKLDELDADSASQYFTGDGYYKTGDTGYFDKDGYLYINGRLDNKIILQSGEKVFPEDIETKINNDEGVSDSCILEINKELYAVVKTKNSQNIKTIMDVVNSGLEPYQKIYRYIEWEQKDFPRLPTLKIDRKKVKKVVEEQIFKKSEETDRVNRVNKQEQSIINNDISDMESSESVLREIVAKITKTSPKNIYENTCLVKELGLDSLKRVALVSLIEEELAVTIPEDQITQNTTLKDLERLLDAAEKNPEISEYPSWPLNPIVLDLRDILRKLLLFPVLNHYVTKINIVNKENLIKIPDQAIIIFNHVGHYDSGLILKILPPRIRKKLIGVGDIRLFLKPFVGFVMYFFGGAYPINKWGGAVKHSLEYIMTLLDQGWSIIISPEGKISEDGTLKEFKKGIGLLTLESGVPIVPFKIKGYERIYTKIKKFPHLPPDGKGEVSVSVGRPIHIQRNLTYEEATEEIENIFKAL